MEWRAAAVELDGLQARISAAAALGVGTILAVAPEHEGPTCPLRALTGVPCPLCGMTTSVVETLRLDVGEALAANPAGVGLVLVSLVVLARRPTNMRVSALLALTALLSMWVFELQRFGIF